MDFALPLAGFGFPFALGVNGFGGVFSIRASTASRELSGGFVMDGDRDEILIAVGEAIEDWGQVEMSLGMLFATLANFRDSEPHQLSRKAFVIFDTIISFETRLEVVDALMAEEGLSELDLETWARCSNRLRKLYKKRHALAHFRIVAEVGDGVTKHRLSPFLTTGKAMAGKLNYLSLTEIQERRTKFTDMARSLGCLDIAARQRRGQHQGSPTPETPLLVQLRALASQILEERKQRQQSSPP